MKERKPMTAVSSDTAKNTKEGKLRKLRFGTVAMVSTVLVVVVVMLLNVVMDTVERRHPITLDLTADGTFSLSEESLKLARGIQNDTEVIVFVGEKMFTANDYSAYSDYLSGMQQMFSYYYSSTYGQAYAQQLYNEFLESFETVLGQFYNMLKEYRVESGGKINYQFIDLDSAPTLAAGYEKYDVQTGTILFRCGERHQKLELSELVGSSSDTETMMLSFNSDVERKVAAKINLVSAPNARKVTILTGHGEDQTVVLKLQDLLLINGCDVVTLDVTGSTAPEADTDIFAIAAPETDYTNEEVQKLMEWLDNGGKREKDLLVFTNPLCHLENLYSLIKDTYHIDITAQLVCETNTDNQYNMGINRVYADVQDTEFTATLVGKRALMPVTNVLKITEYGDKDKDDVYSEVLVSSGDTAKVASVDAIREIGESGGSLSDVTIQSLMTDADSYPVISAAYTRDRKYDNTDDTYYTTDVMVYGSAQFLYSDVMNIPSACNEELFLSVFRGLTGLETTISISSREIEKDYLDFGESTTPTVLGYTFVLGLPLLMIALAIVVFVRRRRL